MHSGFYAIAKKGSAAYCSIDCLCFRLQEMAFFQETNQCQHSFIQMEFATCILGHMHFAKELNQKLALSEKYVKFNGQLFNALKMHCPILHQDLILKGLQLYQLIIPSQICNNERRLRTTANSFV